MTRVSAGAAGSGLARGALLGLAVFSAVGGNLAVDRGYRVHGLNDDPGGAIGLIGFLAGAAVTEELLYRGVLFRRSGSFGAEGSRKSEKFA
ncbi:hypothetical protein [Actinoplanes siamensis]|uniref:CPBP family intramembrane metalloprotease n=1 Tax=Actinoplanes siamensis TaxID=1223317 RepID=A0A919TMS3_9ACTN|nr:hypothetical protein [Actinoplanes siamensis]GIF07869.1 hypothetical protein Asi03nite_54070 [Actinoplanes siamensis]